MREEVLGIYTGKDLSIMEKEGGSGYWVIREKRLKEIQYVLFMQNERQLGSVKKEGISNGQAFLLAEFGGLESQEWNRGRFLIKLRKYIFLENRENFKNAWKKLTENQRFPIAYFSLEELKDKLDFDITQISPQNWIDFKPFSLGISSEQNLKEAILEAKRVLAKIAKVEEDKVNITIQY